MWCDDDVEINDVDRELELDAPQMGLSEYSAVAGVAVNQFIESFHAPRDPYARAALRFSPFLLMSPQQTGIGDPRLIGAVAIAGIVIIGERRDQSRRPRDIRIFIPDQMVEGEHVTVVADVVDSHRALLPAKVTLASTNPEVAVVEGHELGANAAGTTVISATYGEIVRRVVLMVKSASP